MIDLHVHSTISDGMDTPVEIIRKAKKLKLKAVTLTDHDCIDGLLEAQAEAEKLDIIFVKGIELSVSYGDHRLIHILGLGIDPNNAYFKKAYLEYRQSRHNQIDYVIKGLNELNLYPSIEELKLISTDGYLDRQTIAKWLLKRGHTKSMQESWIRYVDHFPYVEGELIDVKTALKMIKEAGGKSFLAHYHKPIGLAGYSKKECYEKLQELKDLGLSGLERYYSDFNEENHLELDDYIHRFDFLTCGGTDYHGSNRASVELGFGNGSLNVPDLLLESIINIEK